MEPETLLVKQEDMEKSDSPVETSINEENIAEKLNENNVEIDVMSIVASQPAVVVPVPFVPDLTLFSYEVQQGYRIVRELLSDQYKSIIYPFLQPVDVEGLNLWDYHARIETPMSFSQIEGKFNSYVYESITAVISDVRLILENCYRYNGSAHWISKLAHKLEKILDQKLALLNRSLREKVTLHATMAFRNKNEIVADIEEPASGGRPRRSGRTSYVVNGMNAEKRSSLMNHLLLEEEENQREMKRMKEKEKKEANEALMQELSEWEDEIFTKNVLKELSLDMSKVESKPTYESLVNVQSNMYEQIPVNCNTPGASGVSGQTPIAEPFYHVVDTLEGAQDPGQICHDPDNCETRREIPGRTGDDNPERVYSTLEDEGAPENFGREVPGRTGDDNPERVYSTLEEEEEESAPENYGREVPGRTGDDDTERVYSVLEDEAAESDYLTILPEKSDYEQPINPPMSHA
ncbi:Homeotic female sterile [Paramuricea clavata]|uniref:Homeotic female sterile n=1 Tax=Paramuricea clavata TaxID=317549 RepID=A0A7D9HY80_PARCT|nr:Homeotic female sterile [Paramuricea clavata]